MTSSHAGENDGERGHDGHKRFVAREVLVNSHPP